MSSKSAPNDGIVESAQPSAHGDTEAQKIAAETLALRRRLEREQQAAARERERERQLLEIQQQLEESELRAELAAIDAEADSRARSRASHVSSTRVSVDRTRNWVDNNDINVNKDIFAVGCEQPIFVTSPGHTALPHIPPTATQATAPPINISVPQQTTNLANPDVAVCNKSLVDNTYHVQRAVKTMTFNVQTFLKRDFYNTMQQEHKQAWKCHFCRSKMPKKDNTNTPIRIHQQDTPETPSNSNVTIRRKQTHQTHLRGFRRRNQYSRRHKKRKFLSGKG
ncbi:hypothetical protein ACJJTC_005349, partial [Scirpophaga incertulas]